MARATVSRTSSGPARGPRSRADRAGSTRVVSTAVASERPRRSVGARTSAALWRRPWLRASLTLSPPLAWFLIIYLASLVAMLVTAFWSVNPFTNNLEHHLTLANFRQIFTATYLHIIWRT